MVCCFESPIRLALPHQKKKTALASGRVPNAKQIGDPSNMDTYSKNIMKCA